MYQFIEYVVCHFHKNGSVKICEIRESVSVVNRTQRGIISVEKKKK